MNYDEINVEDEVAKVFSAIDEGRYRAATKKESMQVRLAALSEIVHEMQAIVRSDKELVEP